MLSKSSKTMYNKNVLMVLKDEFFTMINYIFHSTLFNNQFSLRDQLLISFFMTAIISTAITLGICYTILFTLGDKNSTLI